MFLPHVGYPSAGKLSPSDRGLREKCQQLGGDAALDAAGLRLQSVSFWVGRGALRWGRGALAYHGRV